MSPPVVFSVVLSICVASFASICMITAVSTDHWEHTDYDVDKLRAASCVVTNSSTLIPEQGFYTVTFKDGCSNGSQNDTTAPTLSLEVEYFRITDGGIWRLCDRISASLRATIQDERERKRSQCFNYITDYDPDTSDLDDNGMWLVRLQNSATSCVIVCLMCLLTAALTGTFGLVQKQVSACMVTGVMYIVAGTFAVFALVIMHYKQAYMNSHENCYSMYKINRELCDLTRHIIMGWSVILAWLAVVFFFIAFGCWLALTRIIRLEKSKSIL